MEPIFGRKFYNLNFGVGFLSNKDNKVCLQDFEIVKCIGKGGFAKVFKGEFLSFSNVWHMYSEKKINRLNLCNESHRKDKNR